MNRSLLEQCYDVLLGEQVDAVRESVRIEETLQTAEQLVKQIKSLEPRDPLNRLGSVSAEEMESLRTIVRLVVIIRTLEQMGEQIESLRLEEIIPTVEQLVNKDWITLEVFHHLYDLFVDAADKLQEKIRLLDGLDIPDEE